MTDSQRYPLAWPTGWKRTPLVRRQRAAFTRHNRPLTVADAIARLSAELTRIGGRREILSTNVELRLDGLPRSGQPEPADPGAAVYFELRRKPIVLACDKWARVADNLAAIAQHIDALRRIDRYGVGTLEQAFAGYTALPANTAANWRAVFGFAADARVTWVEVEDRFRELARTKHPDAGGSHLEMTQLSEAKNFARQDLEVGF